MKKLMIATFAIAVAAVVNASTYEWSIQTADGGEIFAAGGESSGLFTGSGYMFELTTAPTLGGSAGIYDLIAGGTSLSEIATTYGGQAVSLSAGATPAGAKFGTDTDIGDAVYLLVLDNGKGGIFFDQELEAGWDYTTGEGVFQIDASWSADGEYTYAKGTPFEMPGWYDFGSTPTPTPEPTSGLLLLLGVAGLALRRRRA